ncbi:hypothetical protein C8Q80DRAFT_1201825 [Daedaleopsis nitida]|nr:hypothetical protein C8Q80DRAFT_1201825 [Daedaleopsis nitida]
MTWPIVTEDTRALLATSSPPGLTGSYSSRTPIPSSTSIPRTTATVTFILDGTNLRTEQLRLIDCRAWLERRTLVIRQHPGPNPHHIGDLPPFCAVYHFWWQQHHPPRPPESRLCGSFEVNDCVPPQSYPDRCSRNVHISWDVLTTLCLTAERCGCPFVWLDALCVMWHDPSDYSWYTQARLQTLYGHSKACVVLPAGLESLLDLHPGRSPRLPWKYWAHAKHTLSRVGAVAPVLVLHHWPTSKGAGWWENGPRARPKSFEHAVVVGDDDSGLEDAERGGRHRHHHHFRLLRSLAHRSLPSSVRPPRSDVVGLDRLDIVSMPPHSRCMEGICAAVTPLSTLLLGVLTGLKFVSQPTGIYSPPNPYMESGEGDHDVDVEKTYHPDILDVADRTSIWGVYYGVDPGRYRGDIQTLISLLGPAPLCHGTSES